MTPRTAARQASLFFTMSWCLLKCMSIESMMPSNCLIRCRPLLLLPSVFPSIRVFYNELALHIRWLKYWSFSSNISPSNKYSGLIFFRIDWFELLGVQGTLKSLLQHQKHQFFIIQPSLWSNSHIRTCCSVVQSCPTLCYLMDCSRPGFLIFHHFPEFAQTHTH